ncbi:MAG: hypothetical protein KF819_15815 [Labilithrix sp.]|nr:hypothetical protein [Labilithrix sp.]
MRPLALVGLTSFAAMGCAVSPSADGPDAEATSTSAAAVVVVERTSGPGDAIRADAIVARFVRVRQGAVDDQTLRIAGVAQDLPAVGTCSARPDEDAHAAPSAQPRGVDLLDVGPVSFASSATSSSSPSTVLLPRAMPDPAGLVSGVFYSARSIEAFAPAARLQLRASGGPDLLDGFAVNVAAPREVSDVHATANGAGVDVAWDATDADLRDVVYVDVLGANAHLVARCATLDVGHLAIPASALGSFEEGQLAVHRVHRESFRAKGIEPGEVRFDVARVIAYHR